MSARHHLASAIFVLACLLLSHSPAFSQEAKVEALPKAAGAQPAPEPALAQAQQPDAIICSVAPAGAGRQELEHVGTPHGWITPAISL